MSADKLSGVIDRVVHRDAESGFTIASIELEDESVSTLLGAMAIADIGLWVEAEGVWVEHPKHGAQFKAESVRLYQARTASGIERFLSSGAVKGIGKHFAKKIVSQYGDETLHVILKQPYRLEYLKGVGKKRIKSVCEAIKEYQEELDVLTFLHERFGPQRAATVFSQYGIEAKEVILSNPYKLVEDIEGLGFQTADELARSVGVEENHELRLRAAIFHLMNAAASNGDTAVTEIDLKRRLKALIEPPEGLADEAIGLIEAGSVSGISTHVDEHGQVFIELKKYKNADIQIAEKLGALSNGSLPGREIDAAKAIQWAEEQGQITFGDDQRMALESCFKNQVSIVTGGPGVGKTTILRAMVKVFEAKRLSMALAAPTGRAARRMAESTAREASTIHRLLGKVPGVAGFKHNEHNPLSIDVLIVDEASMIDLPLFRSLMNAVQVGTRIVAVGDPDQIPSVGAGQVLNDLIDSGRFPVTRMRHTYRQSDDTRIIENAALINQRLVPDLSNAHPSWCFLETHSASETADRIVQLMTSHLPKRGIDTKNDTQVLVPMNKGPSGLIAINERLQATMNGSESRKLVHRGKTFKVNDSVTQRKNNLDLDVSNGDCGRVVAVNAKDHELTVEFEGRRVIYDSGSLSDLDLGFCLSVHRGQGSEWPNVVIGLDNAASILLDKRLLYTACTRAKKKVIIVGQRRAIQTCVTSERSSGRTTLLRERLAAAG